MANTIQDPLLNDALVSDFRLYEPGGFELESFVLPTVVVGELSGARRPPIMRTCVAQFSQAAVAAQRVVFRFTAPNGTICRIKRVRYISGAALLPIFASLHLSAGAAPGNTAASIITDGRITPNVIAPAGILQFGTRATALPAIHWRTNALSNDWRADEPLNWLVGADVPFNAPSTADRIEFETGTDNVALDVTMEWQEWFVGR